LFEMFSGSHLAALTVTVAVLAAIAAGRTKLREEKAGRAMRVGLALLLLACEVSFQLSYVLEDNWSAGSLPFQLCSLMVLLSAAMLLSNAKRLYPVVVFLGVAGALQALITPNLDAPFPEFRYFHFFAAHIGIMAAAMYLIAVERYRPTLRATFGALLWLHVLAIPAAITNIATGTTNFMFLARKPGTASLLDALAPWPWYLLQLELIAAAMCLMMYGIIHFVHWTLRGKTR
jgi:hypothetical integral membrane protein (TIGR02206 family)